MTSLKTRIIRQTNYTSILQASTDGRVWIDVMAGGHWAAVDKAQQLRERGWDGETLTESEPFHIWLMGWVELCWSRGEGGQKKAAAQMGITRQTLNRWLTGRGLPTLGKLRGVLGAIAQESGTGYAELQGQAFRALAEPGNS